MTNGPPRVWFVTGASSGFGAAAAQAALDAGETVIATARRREEIRARLGESRGRLHIDAFDVTDHEQAERAAAAAADTAGRIDVLVNGAGYCVPGGIEETEPERVVAQFRINVFGLINVTRAVLSLMRAQRSGHVVNISGVAGAGAIRTVSGFGIYHASEYAVEGITEALAAEVKDLGIRATLIEPGSFRTDLHTNRRGRPGQTRCDDRRDRSRSESTAASAAWPGCRGSDRTTTLGYARRCGRLARPQHLNEF
jgi:NADP-dependent 3-hydroxy acid dehydrogenase YdfG